MESDPPWIEMNHETSASLLSANQIHLIEKKSWLLQVGILAQTCPLVPNILMSSTCTDKNTCDVRWTCGHSQVGAFSEFQKVRLPIVICQSSPAKG